MKDSETNWHQRSSNGLINQAISSTNGDVALEISLNDSESGVSEHIWRKLIEVSMDAAWIIVCKRKGVVSASLYSSSEI